MSNQKVEEVEDAKGIALELLQAQVEGALSFHIHICHLLVAEAHHSVHGDKFEVGNPLTHVGTADNEVLSYLDEQEHVTGGPQDTWYHRVLYRLASNCHTNWSQAGR